MMVNFGGYKYRFSQCWKRYFIIMLSLIGDLILLPLAITNLLRSKQIEGNRIKKILLVRNDGIGDFVLSLPALNAMRQHFPRAKITAFIPSWQKELALASRIFDEVIIFEPLRFQDMSAIVKLQMKGIIFHWLMKLNLLIVFLHLVTPKEILTRFMCWKNLRSDFMNATTRC